MTRIQQFNLPGRDVARLPRLIRAIHYFAALGLIWGVLSSSGPEHAARAATPDETLAAAGLQRIDRVWYLPAELQFRARLHELHKLERRAGELQTKLDAVISQVEAGRARLQQLETARERAKQLSAAAPAASPARNQYEKEAQQHQALIDQLKKHIPSAEQWGTAAPVAGILRELHAVRAELSVGVRELQRVSQELPRQYDQLAAQNEIAAALQAAQPPYKLGPAKTFASELKNLAQLEAVAFPAALSVQRVSGQWRVGCLLNEQMPLSMTFQDKHEETIMTRSQADTLGIKLAEDAQSRQLQLEGQAVAAWPVRLNSLRVGQAVRENAEIFVLEPSAEFLGARLGYRMIQELGLTLDESHLRVLNSTSKTEKEKK
jgi:hypothetical protein